MTYETASSKDPETGRIPDESDGGNGSELARYFGMALRAAAQTATAIEGTTAQNSSNQQLSQSAKLSNQIHLEVYSRPAAGTPFRHLFLYDKTNNFIWEMSSTCADGNWLTCGSPGAPLGFVHTNTFRRGQADVYLQKWSAQYRKEYTVNLQQESFYKAIEVYERRNKGLAYNPAWHNSNYAARNIVEDSGRQGQHGVSAPESIFDWRAA